MKSQVYQLRNDEWSPSSPQLGSGDLSGEILLAPDGFVRLIPFDQKIPHHPSLSKWEHTFV
jgi:hypothetical protein